MSRPIYCRIHHLRTRCSACEDLVRSNGFYPVLDVPRGTVEWLMNAARFFDEQGPLTAAEFVRWLAADVRERTA